MTGRRWTTPADLAAKVRRRWDDGSLLSAWATHAEFPGFDLPVTGPRASQIGDDVDAVRAWIADLVAGSGDGNRYELELAEIGGRAFGRNRIPVRARITSYDMAWALLGTSAQVKVYGRLLDSAAAHPTVHAWAVAHPLRALGAAGEWEPLLAAYAWLDRARGSRQYLREITAPGVDTKFVERHRGLLSQLLGLPGRVGAFTDALGLQAKPDLIRVRFDEGFLGLPRTMSEATFRTAELAGARVGVQSALIVENEITFLSVPVPFEGVVLWGKGHEVGQLGALPWLRGVPMHYWGDLDTHGFAILDRLRAHHPQARSLLMDKESLLAHRDRWGREPKPTAARLDRLNPDEAALYADLVGDRFAPSVRLEQERIDWAWAAERLAAAVQP